MTENVSSEFKNIRKRLEDSRTIYDHHRVTDSILYNGGTILTLLCTTVATLLPITAHNDFPWLSKVFAGVATFLVAIERALGFGVRWDFNRRMVNAHSAILDDIAFFEDLPEADRTQEKRRDIQARINDLHKAMEIKLLEKKG